MFKKGISTVILVLVLSGLATNVAFAGKTPDGVTPANEGVCDDLFFATPGLYGLCVAFCEAQDCEATLDPTSGEVEYAANCKPSSSNILDNYNRRKTSGDPSMPCVNEAANECPCWTETELDWIGDGQTLVCDEPFAGFTRIVGLDGNGGDEHVVANAGNGPGDGDCFYQERTPNLTTRLIDISDEEVEICRQSILLECAHRGL